MFVKKLLLVKNLQGSFIIWLLCNFRYLFGIDNFAIIINDYNWIKSLMTVAAKAPDRSTRNSDPQQN